MPVRPLTRAVAAAWIAKEIVRHGMQEDFEAKDRFFTVGEPEWLSGCYSIRIVGAEVIEATPMPLDWQSPDRTDYSTGLE